MCGDIIKISGQILFYNIHCIKSINETYVLVYLSNIISKGEHIMNKKQTSPSVASKASKALRSNSTSKTTKTLAGTALSQTRTPSRAKKK